jgi:hypothetical protein
LARWQQIDLLGGVPYRAEEHDVAVTDDHVIQRANVTTDWLRCADRTSTRHGSEEAANLGHNQQIVGDKIYLSGYHSGVTVLDASAAFAGKRGARPRELAFVVPSGTPTRPLYDQVVGPAIPFVSTFTQARPLVWDQVFYIPPGAGPKAGRILAADITGGFYSYREAGAR